MVVTERDVRRCDSFAVGTSLIVMLLDGVADGAAAAQPLYQPAAGGRIQLALTEVFVGAASVFSPSPYVQHFADDARSRETKEDSSISSVYSVVLHPPSASGGPLGLVRLSSRCIHDDCCYSCCCCCCCSRFFYHISLERFRNGCLFDLR